jgi:hypothetical protein
MVHILIVLSTMTVYMGTNRKILREWQQFTGLKDNKGKEIWEGDIIAYNPFPERNTHKGYIPKPKRVVGWKQSRQFIGFNLGINTNCWQVIGNIYENPNYITMKENFIKCPDCGNAHDPRYTEHTRNGSEEMSVESLEKRYYGKGYIDGYKKGKEEGNTIFQ